MSESMGGIISECPGDFIGISNFYFDVGPRPSWRHLVIRDDPGRPFEPGNARWQVQRPRYRRRRSTAR
jgi:hypothetical protein